MSRHLCHARQCQEPVPPSKLMCRKHWFMVPAAIRSRVWALYRPGQEIRKDPTPEYLEAANEAVEAVAEKEGI